jgi:putative nucleotidyltransferase with HDIG domain
MGTPRSLPRRRAPYARVPSAPHVARAVLLALLLAACLALTLFVPGAVSQAPLQVGDVAGVTVLAPYSVRYVDAPATAALRRQASAAVRPRYRMSTARQDQASSLLVAVVSAAAGMQYQGKSPAGAALRAAALVRVSQGAISLGTARLLLTLSPRQLAHVQAIALATLAAERTHLLADAQLTALRQAPPIPVSEVHGPVRQADGALFAAFLRSNRAPDVAATQAARQAAAAIVSPITMVYRPGQAIVHAGDVVTPASAAALQAAGLDTPGATWQDLAADVLVSLVVAGLLHGYLISIKSPILVRPRRLLLLDAVFLATSVAAALVLRGHGVLPYVFPAATLSMLLTTLLSAELSVVAAVLWAMLVGWCVGGSFEVATYYLVVGLAGALLVRDVRRSSEFFVAAFWTSLVGLVTIMAFRLLNHGYDWLGIGTYTASVLVGAGLAAALTLGSLSALGRVFGVTTGINLLEISHPNHPLLRRLMQEAPGTFHHSMMVGTLAERAAEQIGADALQVRIVAYFHDIGKLYDPACFAENQLSIANVHEQLEPARSAQLILRHVYEGVRLAREPRW